MYIYISLPLCSSHFVIFLPADNTHGLPRLSVFCFQENTILFPTIAAICVLRVYTSSQRVFPEKLNKYLRRSIKQLNPRKS